MLCLRPRRDTEVMRVNGDRHERGDGLLLGHCASFGRAHAETAPERVERELGPRLARVLVAALSPRYGAPRRSPGV